MGCVLFTAQCYNINLKTIAIAVNYILKNKGVII